MIPGAVISDDGLYRYRLTRVLNSYADNEWPHRIAWLMLNPSTADAASDDMTVKTITAFSQLWGYTRLDVGNIYAFRATDPGDMKRAYDPVGPQNLTWLARIARDADTIVCAWGNHALPMDVERALSVVRKPLFCLGRNANGTPKHPLYQPRATVLVPYACPT